MLVIHPSTRAIELYRNVDSQPDLVDPNVDGSVELKSVAGVRLSTVNTPDGPRLRITAPDGTTTDV